MFTTFSPSSPHREDGEIKNSTYPVVVTAHFTPEGGRGGRYVPPPPPEGVLVRYRYTKYPPTAIPDSTMRTMRTLMAVLEPPSLEAVGTAEGGNI